MRLLFAILVSGLLISGCAQQQTPVEDDPKVVLISWYYPNNDYQRWLGEADSTIQFFQAYGMAADSLETVIGMADAILMTGGYDIDPSAFISFPEANSSYGGIDSLRGMCGKIDPYRDSLEFELVAAAFEKDIPLFGGCRGMQIINVQRGGSLIIDLPTQRNTSIHQSEGKDSQHTLVDAGWNAFLGEEIPDSSIVNSNHHQAIDELAEGFEVLAYAEDSVIEAMIWKDTSTGPEIICWQWHPERMERDEPYARVLRKKLLAHLD